MIEIREATVSDIDTIADITEKTFPATYGSILSLEQIDYMMNLMYSRESIGKQMEDQTFLIAICDGSAAGFVSFCQTSESITHIHKLYILPSYQRRGIGRIMIEKVREKTATKADQTVVELNVNKKNSALEFYKKMGMRIVRTEDNDIGKGFFMNDYVMQMAAK